MSLGGVIRFPRRGQSSCFHQWERLPAPAQRDAVEGLILQAVDLLPVEEMPVLLRCVVGGGGCLGVLDPVSNVILNAVSYLDRLERPPAAELARRALLFGYQKRSEDEDNQIQGSIDMASFGNMWLDFTCKKSMDGLAEFMENYFRYLSKAQAARYLELAGMDLTLAVHLVHHDRFAAQQPPPVFSDLSNNKMLAALKLAALEIKLWAPVDDLVLLATSKYPRGLLEEATAPLLRRQKLCRDDIDKLLCLMRWRSSNDTGGCDPPSPVHLTVLRRPEDMASRLSCCLQSMSMVPPRRVRGPATEGECEYVRCLRLCLVDTMHVLYLEALARLPAATARRHIRGLMLAGHCYGLLDPVSNIVLNSIWYDIAFPPPPPAADDDEQEAAGDVLDNRCLLRVQRRSLDGLVALVGATALLSEHDAVEYLCYKSCDVVSGNEGLQTAMLDALSSSSSSHGNLLFATVAEAAKHPQPLALAEFLASIAAPEQLDRLRSLLNHRGPGRATTTLSGAAIEQIYELLRGGKHGHKHNPSPASSALVPELCPGALRILASKKEAFKEQQRFIRRVLDDLLHRYAASHPKEPRYELGVICGAAVSARCMLGSSCYHVNFLAASAIPDDDGHNHQTLFFAEFGPLGTSLDPVQVLRLDESEPAFCRPVPLSADQLGRCFPCEGRSSRILHPATGSYHSNAGKDIKDATPLPFRYWNTFGAEAEASVDGQHLQSDFIYFDHTRDARFAELLNEVGSQEQRARFIRPVP